MTNTDTIYVDHWSTEDAYRAGEDDYGLVSPAPFGDNTYRVIDESAGGVVAYFGDEHTAREYAGFLRQDTSLAAAWQQGRDSVALDMAKPLPFNMIRETTPNPYIEA